MGPPLPCSVERRDGDVHLVLFEAVTRGLRQQGLACDEAGVAAPARLACLVAEQVGVRVGTRLQVFCPLRIKQRHDPGLRQRHARVEGMILYMHSPSLQW